jgi:benzoylformate decarboxylase
MYAIQGLWTAAQLKLPITLIMVYNRRYEALLQFGRLGADLAGGSCCKLVNGHGSFTFR